MRLEPEATRAARIAATAHLCVCAHVQASPWWRESEPGTPCAAIAKGERHHEWCPLATAQAAPVRYDGHGPRRRPC